MKNQSFIIFLFILLMSIVGANALAHDIEAKNADGVTIYYRWINNKTELMVSFIGNDESLYPDRYYGNVVIPRSVKYDGMSYTVTGIDSYAFWRCSGLTSVTIPKSVAGIGFAAFSDCSGLMTIVSEIEMPFKIHDSTFGGDPYEVAELIVPKGTKALYQTTEGWYNFKKITESSVSDNSNPTPTPPPPVTTVVKVNITIKNTTSKDITIRPRLTFFLNYKGQCAELVVESLFGDDTKTIAAGGEETFSNIEIPGSRDYLDCHFADREVMNIASIPANVNNVMLYDQNWNSSTIVPDMIDTSEEFSDGGSYTIVYSKETQPEPTPVDPTPVDPTPVDPTPVDPTPVDPAIGSTFYQGGIYYKVGDNQTVSVISGEVNYSGDVVIPSQVTYDGKNYSVTSIKSGAFDRCKMTSVTIPGSITSIGAEAFCDCISLSSVYITDLDAWCKISFGYRESNPLYYAHHLFLDGAEIRDLRIPNSVTYIARQTFEYCDGLTSVEIPNSVTSIGDGAFKKCSGLTSVTIPKSVTSIGELVFGGCSGLNSIKVEKGNLYFFSIDGCNAIIDISSNTLLCGCKNTVIPNNVKSIGSYAFYGCSGLTSLTIPGSVTRISDRAFQSCISLSSITIPNSVKFIGDYAFGWCTGLTSVISEIKQPYKISDNVFSGFAAELIVPEGTKALYQATEGWNKFSKITEVSNTSQNYYVIGAGAGWTTTGARTQKFNHSGADIYEDPIFTIIVESGGDDCWFAIGDDAALDAIDGGDWTKLLGTKGANEDLSGTMDYRYNLGGDHSFHVTGAKKLKITLNMMDYSYTIEPINIADAYYLIGGPGEWTAESAMTMQFSHSEKDVLEDPVFTYVLEGGQDLWFAFGDKEAIEAVGNGVWNLLYGTTGDNMELSGSFKRRIDLDGDHSFNVYGNAEKYIFSINMAEMTYEITPINITDPIQKSRFYFDGICYYVDDNENVSVVSRVPKYKGDIYIPEKATYYNGKIYTVSRIGNTAFSDCSSLTSVTIPKSVASIGYGVFSGCSGLTSIKVESSNPYYDSRNDCNAIIETSSNVLIAGCKNTIIPNSVTSIGQGAFSGCSGLTSVTIPNSVTSIGKSAFYNCSGMTSVVIPNSAKSIGDEAFSGCSGLTSATIPNSVTSIGAYAFLGCSNLMTIVSEIEKPFEVNCFNFDTSAAELIVPKGTKALYQATEGWNKFTKITEAGDKDEVAFAIDGINYQGSKSEKNVVVKSMDTSKIWVEIPASVSYDGKIYQVTGIDDDALKGSSMAALIWNVEIVLPNNIFSNASIGSNFLLYVKSASYAPSSVKNVIESNMASSIQLSDDGGPFYCPQTFTARSISYTHNYSMETGGNGKGWETLALPFDVQKILHSTRGEIVPFPSYNSGSTQKPFWLANFSGNGFRRTAAVLANEPYIIAMPNSSSYRNEYNLAGDVTFSADNVQVPKTPSFSGTFVPAFATVAKSSSVYALNVNNRNVKYSGSYDAGSRFISGLRDVRPFEAYMTSGSSSRGVIEINFDDGTTGIEAILFTADDCQEMTIHALSGQQVTRTTQRDFGQVWDNLPKGVYIVNGKKKIK